MDKLTCWRHRRIWIKPSSIGSIIGASELTLGERQFLEDWVKSGKPLVGRATNPLDQSGKDFVPLGLMLHLADAPKKRLNLQVDSTSILKVEEPLNIQVVMTVLSPSIVAKLEKMLARVADYPILVRVFGSAFWSYEGEQNYMTEYSDIDLLISPFSNCDLLELAKTLRSLSDEIDLRLDGEFEFLNGWSVNWREYASNATELLVKSELGPKIVARQQIMEEFHVF